MKTTGLICGLITAMLFIAGCGGPKTPAEVDRSVAEASKDAAKDVAVARNEAAEDVASAEKNARKEIQGANQQTAGAQADVAKAAAEANYKVSIEKAEGDHRVSIEKCAASSGDVRKSCTDVADAALAADKAKAEQARAYAMPGTP